MAGRRESTLNELRRDLYSLARQTPGFFLWVLQAPSSIVQAMLSYGTRVRGAFTRSSPWIFLSIFLIVPLYLVAGAFAIRSGVFDLSDQTIGGEEHAAVWAFLGAGVAAGATLIGALLTERAHVRSSKAQALESVVAGLNLIGSNEGTYAPKAQVAGALATLVHLGHPLIAMRTLAVAWQERKVDSATACWLIDETLRSGSDESKNEAAALLVLHTGDLTDDTMESFDWPDGLMNGWLGEVPLEARFNVIRAALELMLSRDINWWGGCPHWVIIMLNWARTTDPNPTLRQSALNVLMTLLSHLPPDEVITFEPEEKAGDGSMLTVAELKRRIQGDGPQSRFVADSIEDQRRRIDAFFETPLGGTDSAPGTALV